MKRIRILSLLLAIVMLFARLPMPVYAAEGQNSRSVWVHAQGPSPQATTNVTRVYLNDPVDVYFAIDNPNKGAYENNTHTQPWNDLNGYTVKIWYDPDYLELPVDGKLDVTVPTSAYGSGTYVEEPYDEVGYYIYRSGKGSETINGHIYNYAYVTVFFSGFWLPQKADGALWYNLAKLPLKAKHTGSTDVWVETDEALDPVNVSDALELFAKNESSSYDPTFQWTAVNGGYHHINIVEKTKPAPPVASPIPGSYTSTQTVTLTAEEDCVIWYTLDGNTWQSYNGPITVSRTQTISTYAVRNSDGKQSNTVSYTYNIIPEAPQLFQGEGADKTPIGNVHYEANPFTVYAAVGSTYGQIPTGSTVYYTFSETLSVDDIEGNSGDNPQTAWVAVGPATPKVGDNLSGTITARHTVRLVTVLGEEHSDVNWYYLGIQPAPVSFTPESGVQDSDSVTVQMNSDTANAVIYYTTDGSDPRSSSTRQLYNSDSPPVFGSDVSIRAAAFYDEIYSEVTGAWYVLTQRDDFGVSAFYPPGVYDGGVQVTLSAQNPDYTIWYYTDHGTTWSLYNGTLTLEEDTTIQAKAVAQDGQEGTVYSFDYTIRPKPPVFAPESTQFSSADTITIFCGSDRTDENGGHFLLYYTIDGSDPTTHGTPAGESDSAEIPITRYTVVKAAVLRDVTWSSVVTHAYDVVYGKATAPLVTLTPGYYTLEPGQTPYTTQFVPVPSGTTIYYTTDGTYPDVNDPSQAYTPGTEIPVNGRTILRAVAVNALGYKSDVAVFDYTVAPAAPVAAPSAAVSGSTLPMVPVTAVQGATVTYSINGNTYSFFNDGSDPGVDYTTFYLDSATGIAYRDTEKTQKLAGPDEPLTISSPATVSLKAALNGVESGTNNYVYRVNAAVPAAPWADKPTGTYEELALDDNNTLLLVTLNSLNTAGTIQYRLNNGTWVDYNMNNPIRLYYDLENLEVKADSPIRSDGTAVLQARVQNGDTSSATVTYVYHFVPVAPVITLPSGQYSYTVNGTGDPIYPTTTLSLDTGAPDTAGLYSIYYRANGDSQDYPYQNVERVINHTMSLRAYTINTVTGAISDNTVHYYIIESPSAAAGTVYTIFPYEVVTGGTLDIASHLLDDEGYNDGMPP